MGKHNEQVLSALENLADSGREVRVPERIDDYIRNGMRKAQEERKASARIRKAWSGGAVAAAVLLLAFMTTVRVSPAFAAIVSEVPGLGYIAKMVAGDKGLTAAINNDYIQKVGVSDSHDGITVTVDGIIADETRMNIFYTIVYPKDYKKVELRDIHFLKEDGTRLESGYSWGYRQEEDQENGVRSSRIDVNFGSREAFPDTFLLETKVARSDTTLAPTWTLPITVDRERMKGLKTVYPIGQTVTVEGQRITFVSAAVHPTQIAVEVEFDPDNAKKIFSFVDLTLVGDQGETYQNFGSSMSENKLTLFFQGSSFSIPKSLTMKGSRLRALDKDKLELVVDTDNKELLKAPDDRVRLNGIKTASGQKDLSFTLSGIAREDNMLYSLAETEFTDGSGATFNVGAGGMYSSTDMGDITGQRHTFYIPDQDYVQPLTFKIANYPGYIVEHFEVKIKE
ncbi:DUF4179 domain-containing protein [Paenibacillus thermotolerans]|uniref:DUF4179 domain-containing protein n=1 Tax=Paenibacillus thermotolerans TaxID=3027807 RepID=UPI002367ED96|nr:MULTISPECIES: DUF4179 domain-containing protein [unclassified Paenibacillus]